MVRERTRFDRMVGRNGVRRELTPARQMWAMLERYRGRADRSGQVFSVAVFRSDGSLRSVRRMARLIAGRVRLSDEVGWLEGGSVCAILPDTSAAGAACFAADIVRLVQARCGKPQFTLYSYPTDSDRVDQDESGPDDFSQYIDKKNKDKPESVALCRALSREGDAAPGVLLKSETLWGKMGHFPGGRDGNVSRGEGEAIAPAAQPLEPWFVRKLPFWKRAVDVLGAIGLLGLSAPAIAVVALMVKLSSPGPVIFRQERAGLGGRPFTIYKFRTMRQDADAAKHELRARSEQDGPAFKLSDDPRVTPVGAILRKTSIDELPQLVNVLKGEMSLVGPRPLPVEESAGCNQWQRRRLEVTPGLTCVWQVKGRSRVTFEQWARMDIGYLTRRTLAGDLKLILQTVPAVLLRRGAR
jgi:lipopolysaccharide/colanic/teichoic acid biosynthesis glycosyltransferase